jgi:hypothetical protein
VCQPASRAPQSAPGEKRTEPVFEHTRRQSAQNRENRLSEQDERRSHDDQQQMLHHVGFEQQIPKRIERGRERDKQRSQATEIRREPLRRIAARRLAAQLAPAADI